MKRSMILVVSVFILVLLSVCLADQMGIVGEIFAGRSGVTRGFITLHNGASGTTPAYLKVESSDGTYQYVFADDDGGFRYHTAIPTADTDGTAFVLSTDSVDPNHMADADHGDFTISSGSATLDADVVAAAEMADADHGDGTWASGVFSIDADVIDPNRMADADHGSVSWTSGVASIDEVDVGAVYDTNNVTADLVTFADSRYYIVTSSGAEVSGTLAAGSSTGEMVSFMCKVAGNDIDITVANHVTSDPEVIRLDTAAEWIDLLWDGTDWVEVGGNGQTYP